MFQIGIHAAISSCVHNGQWFIVSYGYDSANKQKHNKTLLH